MAFEQLHAYSNRKRPSHAPGAEQPAVVAGLGGVAEEGLQDGTSYGGRVDEPVVRDPNWDAEWRRLLEAMPTYEEVRRCRGVGGGGEVLGGRLRLGISHPPPLRPSGAIPADTDSAQPPSCHAPGRALPPPPTPVAWANTTHPLNHKTRTRQLPPPPLCRDRTKGGTQAPFSLGARHSRGSGHAAPPHHPLRCPTPSSQNPPHHRLPRPAPAPRAVPSPLCTPTPRHRLPLLPCATRVPDRDDGQLRSATTSPSARPAGCGACRFPRSKAPRPAGRPTPRPAATRRCPP